MDVLRAHGWDGHFEAAFAALGSSELRPARVVEEQRGMFRVVSASGELRAEIAGRLRQPGAGPLPAVGDWVALAGDTDGAGECVCEVDRFSDGRGADGGKSGRGAFG